MRNPKFLGVYSLRKPGSKSKPIRYFVWQLNNDSYAAQELDSSLSPVSAPVGVTIENFKRAFREEPSILAVPVVTPDFRQIASRKSTAPETDDAEFAELEKARRAKQIENDMRANFNKAIHALSRPRDRKGAVAALERIASSSEGIVPAHKHMFRDFGVTLRKKSLPKLALACARRVVELAPDDDHARFNLARMLGVLGRYDDAVEELRKAIQMDPNEKVYSRLGRYLAREQKFAEETRLNPDWQR